jgi:hypothetical protein
MRSCGINLNQLGSTRVCQADDVGGKRKTDGGRERNVGYTA